MPPLRFQKKAWYFVGVSFFCFWSSLVFAWEDHERITRLSLASWDKWDDVPFEPLEKVLPDLRLGGAVFSTRQAFFDVLQIHGEKVDWDSHGPTPRDADSAALTLLAWSSLTPDGGMDQNLNLSPDQETMGGTT